MPPIRTESSHKLANQEGKILLALRDIKSGRILSIRAAARLYDLPETTLHSRAYGIQLRVDYRPTGYKLTQLEEVSLTEWILSMDICGAVSRPTTVREMVNILLAAREETSSIIGKNWSLIFINCCSELRICFLQRYDYQRVLNKDLKSIRQWFATV
ncbi:uncharacterized protein N7469_000586 [Penicillium citrinum]|uniref:HTH psq-type domain-containing protein n=1 Tax=Penicillium citrinum TaxID=5077 RepID=A0A9W9TVI7_PENCI|nr:uncharacterized protein N7469_000586 [Penicillium citrinum]KAJ5242259.1 hypothetical protein N7469_000586 [Penicillium citrinum]